MNHHNQKIHESDEGELKFKVFKKDGVITIDFGKPVAWIGLGPGEVLALINVLRKYIK